MPYTDLSTQDFKKGMTSDENFVLIDVRTPAEFEEGHIPGAINIDVQGMNFVSEMEKLDKEKTYYVNCRSGGRSGRACQIMGQMGFTGKLYNLEGGILGWSALGYEIVE